MDIVKGSSVSEHVINRMKSLRCLERVATVTKELVDD